MPYSLWFQLKGLPPLNVSSNRHWRVVAAKRKQWRLDARNASVGAGRPGSPLESASVTCTRFSSSEPDADNLAISFKPILDGIVDAGILEDDKPSVIGTPTYRWEKAPRGKGRVEIKVEEA